MTDESFLSRWSRRKRTANVSASPEPPVSGTNESKGENVVPSSQDTAESDEEFDLSTLPSLESISATTDVSAFLRKGVPLALSREALRRAWVADPTIRDFVGLAENAWDFNDPNAMPGFGPLDYTPKELRDLVARIVGGAQRAADDIADVAAPPPGTDQVPAAKADRLPEAVDVPAAAAGQITRQAEQRKPGYVAARVPETDLRERQENSQRRADGPSVVRRTHGSALPR